jgi:hypothetical protein
MRLNAPVARSNSRYIIAQLVSAGNYPDPCENSHELGFGRLRVSLNIEPQIVGE